jgi:UPF0755 protein
MVRKLLISAGFLFVIGALSLAGSWYWLQNWANSPGSISQRVLVVERGASLIGVSKQIFSEKPTYFIRTLVWYAQIHQLAAIKSGEYQLDDEDSWQTILETLNEGNVIKRQVTLVEGWTIAEALAHLQTHEKLTATLESEFDEALLVILPEDHRHPEGWFYADTYQYQSGDTDLDILKRAHKRMLGYLQESWQSRYENLPFASAYEGLILASIVEKETGSVAERPVIASVFTQRLRIKMRLQTDPTVIYGLGASYNGNITRKHLRQHTDYNTYVIKGLPPTPIALVGKEAIDAVFHPAPEEYLYFVAKGDGSHYFSKTLDEHNKAVREYQLVNRAKDYRSQPQN